MKAIFAFSGVCYNLLGRETVNDNRLDFNLVQSVGIHEVSIGISVGSLKVNLQSSEKKTNKELQRHLWLSAKYNIVKNWWIVGLRGVSRYY